MPRKPGQSPSIKEAGVYTLGALGTAIWTEAAEWAYHHNAERRYAPIKQPQSSVLQPRWDPLAKSNRLQNVADSTLGVPAIKVRDQLWDQLATTESDRDVLSRSCMPTTPGLKAIPQSRRADSNRGPLHYE